MKALGPWRTVLPSESALDLELLTPEPVNERTDMWMAQLGFKALCRLDCERLRKPLDHPGFQHLVTLTSTQAQVRNKPCMLQYLTAHRLTWASKFFLSITNTKYNLMLHVSALIRKQDTVCIVGCSTSLMFQALLTLKLFCFAGLHSSLQQILLEMCFETRILY